MSKMKLFGFVVLGVGAFAIVWVALTTLGVIGATVNQTIEVANAEVGPKALNAKYKWFKDCLAALDAKRAIIVQLDSKITRLRADYPNVPRGEWASNDRQSLNQWETERDGIVASYNNLAAEYNSAMSKFHTAFLNAGMVPAGGDPNMPREVRNYMTALP